MARLHLYSAFERLTATEPTAQMGRSEPFAFTPLPQKQNAEVPVLFLMLEKSAGENEWAKNGCPGQSTWRRRPATRYSARRRVTTLARPKPWRRRAGESYDSVQSHHARGAGASVRVG